MVAVVFEVFLEAVFGFPFAAFTKPFTVLAELALVLVVLVFVVLLFDLDPAVLVLAVDALATTVLVLGVDFLDAGETRGLEATDLEGAGFAFELVFLVFGVGMKWLIRR